MTMHGSGRRRSRLGAFLVMLGLVAVVVGIMPAAMASGNQFNVTRVPASSFQPVAAGGGWDFTVGVRQNRFDATSPSILDLTGGGVGLKNLDTGDDPPFTNLKACGQSRGLPAASYVLPASWLSITSPGLPYTIPARSNPAAEGDPYYNLDIRVSPPPGATLGTYSTMVKLETDKTANANFTLCVQVIEPPTGNIVVHKATDPLGSGQAFTFDPSWGEDFSLKGGESHDSGQLLTGPYSVAETVPPGWRLADAWCVPQTENNNHLVGRAAEVLFRVGFPPDQILLGPGQTVHCYFLNEQFGRIIVNKGVAAGAPAAVFGFAASFGNFSLAGGASHDSGLIPPGVYSVAEMMPLAEGWSLASAYCNDGSDPAAIGVSPGETVTCTFNNRYEAVGGSLTIIKRTTPAGGAGFGFDGTLGAFTLDDGGFKMFEDLDAGEYTVTETPADGWEFEDVTCFGAAGAVVDLPRTGRR